MRAPAALLIGALLLAPAIAQEKKPTLLRWKSGEQSGTVRIGDQDESFVALVPRGYTTRRKWPVVLLAHGNGGQARSFLQQVKPMAGKRPPLLIGLERCDNRQNAVGYVPKYLVELEKQFSIDPDQVYALGFSGGGFRLWDDIVCKKEVLPRFRGVVLVGCGKQSFDPPQAPEKAPTIVFVGDPGDQNYGKSRPAAAEGLKERGFEVIVHEHASGHSMPPREIKAVFAWISKEIKASKRKRAGR
jgi:predicted esterase